VEAMKRLAPVFSLVAACGILVFAAAVAADSRLSDIVLLSRIAR
jgi:hypothetical protein